MPVDSTRRIEEEIDELEVLLQPGREEDLKVFLLLLHPADVADLIAEVDEETSIAVLKHLDEERSAELLSELEPDEQRRILSLTQPQQFARIVAEMDSDDIADLLQELPSDVAKDLLSRLPLEEREDVTELLGYDPESAGGIMQTELVSVFEEDTVAQALEAIRAAHEEIDTINAVYVVDEKKRHKGDIPLQTLIFASPDKAVEDVMEPQALNVTTDVDQEEVAKMFDHYGVFEIAVVDRVDRLRGRITADDIHDVLIEEAEEDMMLVAGAGHEPDIIYSDKIAKIAWMRLPWLFATCAGGLIAAFILEANKASFNHVLLAFVPVITGMSGNVGTQSAMIMIQGLAVGHIAEDELKKAILRDFLVSLLIASACGLVVMGFVTVWKASFTLGLCIGLSLAVSIVTASVLGSVEPVILKRFGIDPAIAAGPVITSINDITGVAIYALVVTQFLKVLEI